MKQNALLSSFLDSWDVLNFEFILDQLLKQWLTRREGEDGNMKIWISREQKANTS